MFLLSVYFGNCSFQTMSEVVELCYRDCVNSFKSKNLESDEQMCMQVYHYNASISELSRKKGSLLQGGWNLRVHTPLHTLIAEMRPKVHESFAAGRREVRRVSSSTASPTIDGSKIHAHPVTSTSFMTRLTPSRPHRL